MRSSSMPAATTSSVRSKNPSLKRGVRETLPLLPALDAAFHERTRVVVLDARAVDLDLMDRSRFM